MKASFRYVLRNLRKRRSRTLIGAAGIFLTLTLLTAIQIGIDSVSTSYVDLVALQAGKADVILTRSGAGPFNPQAFDPAEVLNQLEGETSLRGLAPRLLGMVQIEGAGEEHFVVLLGLNLQRERELDISGLAPVPTLKEGTCAVSSSLAEKLNAQPGTSVTVRSPATFSEQTLRLESIIKRQLVVPQEVRDYLVANESTARALLGETSRVHSLAGAFVHPRSFYDARDLHGSVLRLKNAGEALATRIGLDYDIRLPKAAAITAFQHFTSPVRAVFGVFALLALSITGLLIYSLVSVSVEERIREYGILRTLGAKSRDIFHLVLSESVLLCLLGVVPGVLAGTGLARGIVKLLALAMKSQDATLTLDISRSTLWLSLGAGVALSIGSALVPAFRATRWRIVDALDPLRRGQIPPAPPPEGRAGRALLITGLALSTLSVVVFFILPAAFLSGDPSLIGTVVLCLVLSILFGFTLVIVGLLPYIERAVLWLTRWAFGPVAELAGRNLERHRRRHTTTALLFTLSVALVIFLASLIALFSRTALALVENSHGADLRIQEGQSIGDSLKAHLEATPGVAAVSEARFLRGRSQTGVAYDVVASDLVGLKHLWIVPFGADENLSRVLYTDRIVCASGSSPAAVSELHANPVHPILAERDRGGAGRGSLPSPSHPLSPPVARPTDPEPLPALILSQAAASFLDVTPGDPVLLSFHLGAERSEARFRVAAVFSALPGFGNFRSRVVSATGSGALLSLDNFRVMTAKAPPETFQSVCFVKAAGNTPEAQKKLARDIRSRVDARHRFGVKCTAEQKEQTRVLYWVTQIFFGLMLTVAVIIAVFALIASMASTVLERRWEIGVLKALGLRRKELFRLFLAEAVVLTLSAGLAGGAVGFTLAWLFVLQAAVLMEIATVFTMPYLTFLATFAVSLLAGAIAAHLPTRNLLRKPAAEILRL